MKIFTKILAIAVTALCLVRAPAANAEILKPSETNGFSCTASYYSWVGGLTYYQVKDSAADVNFTEGKTVDANGVYYSVSISRKSPDQILMWFKIRNKNTKASASVSGVSFDDNRLVAILEGSEVIDGNIVQGLSLVCEPRR